MLKIERKLYFEKKKTKQILPIYVEIFANLKSSILSHDSISWKMTNPKVIVITQQSHLKFFIQTLRKQSKKTCPKLCFLEGTISLFYNLNMS